MDLYYRFKTHQITIPPLRERVEDIPVLVHHFLERAAKDLGKPVPVVPPELIVLLRNYNYPGNVRELEGLIFDAVSRQRHIGTLSCETFKEILVQQNRDHSRGGQTEDVAHMTIFPTQLPTIFEIERQLVNEALKRTDGNISLAAIAFGRAFKLL